MKIEAHSKYQESVVADFLAKAATTESIKVMTHVDEVQSARHCSGYFRYHREQERTLPSLNIVQIDNSKQ